MPQHIMPMNAHDAKTAHSPGVGGCPSTTDCTNDGSANWYNFDLTYHPKNGQFRGTFYTNLCSQNHYGYCENCVPPQWLNHTSSATCTVQKIPDVTGPSEAALRGRVGLSMYGVNIYGPM